MNIQDFRDIIIIIWGIIGILAFIIVAVLMFILYGKVKQMAEKANATLDKVEAVANRAEELSTYAGNRVAKPLIRVAAVIQGVSQGARIIERIFQRGGHDGN